MKSRSDLPSTSDQDGRQRKKWVEPVAALLMALATLSTAWCSFQSAAWTRKSNRLMNEFNSLERKAGLLTIQGVQQATIHTGMFMQLLAAQQAGNEKLVDFYVKRFPPDVRKAYDAWIAQKPFENPNADPHPFVPKLYEIRGTREAAELNSKAASTLEEARSAGNISGQYLANTVLFCHCAFLCQCLGKIRTAARALDDFHLRRGGFHLCRCAHDHAFHVTIPLLRGKMFRA
jgi:hypothetical protein